MNTNKMNTKYNLSIESITPEKAKAFLSTCIRNRNLSKNRVATYADTIKRGKWCSASMIIFDQDGCLIDGSHRLNGVIEANETVEMSVFRGLEKEFVPFIDTGRPRSAGDMLAFVEGTDDLTSLRNLAALIRVVKYYEKKNFSCIIPYDEISAMLLENKELAKISYQNYSQIRSIGGTIAVGSAFFLIRKHNPVMNDVIEEFFKQVKLGENLQSGMPTYALRNTLFNTGRGKGAGCVRQLRDLCSVLRAWEAFVNNETLKLIKVGTFKIENMPNVAIIEAEKGGAK